MSDETEKTKHTSQSSHTEAAATDTGELDITAEALAEANDAIAEESNAAPTPANGGSELDRLQTERDSFFELWRRTQAELDNYRKRVQREAELASKFASLPLIRDLLPALDNVNRTVQAAETASNMGDLIQGLQMVLRQFNDAFAMHSAKPIKAVGEMFDPNLHQAVQQIPTNDHPPMTVIQELERGYTLDDRVIRPTKVLVAAPLPDKTAE